MAPSAVYSQAQAAAIKAGKKRKRDELKPAVQEEEEIASLDGESEQDEDSDEEASGSEQDDDDDDEDEAGADASAMSVFSDIEPKFSNGKGKQREVAKSDNGKVFKQKTLILCSRGITHRMRHMMKDLGALLPHSKTDAKLDTKHQLSLLNELADLSNCSSALFFEARRHADLYMWCSLTPNGPSVRFHLLNAHTMDELKMTGNCLKGSRPIVVFDKSFDESSHFRLMKEVLMQIFAVPKTARRAKPFVDHVTSFSVADGKIWFRNYQIVHDAPLDLSKATAAADETPEEIARKAMKLSKNAEDNMSMNEIGPRFVLTPVKIFEGSFGGAVVWENKDWTTPQAKLQNAKMAKAVEYRSRKGQELERKGRKEFLETQELADREASGRAALDKRRVFA